MALSPELREELRQRLRWDTAFWAKHCATILTERKEQVRIVPRPWQLEFDAALEKQRAAGLPMRAIILKARKLGFSTWVQVKYLQRVTQLQNQYALVAAQDRKTAGVLMDMAEMMYAKLPTEQELGLGINIRPEILGGSKTRNGPRYMTLGDRLRRAEASVYETITAGATAAGRGYTPSMIHASEVAWWEDPGFLVGLLNAVPDVPETIVVLESTANGFNHFHERWEMAVAGAEDPETGGYYAPLFFGWQDNPENSRQFISDQARARFEESVGDEKHGGDEEELWLIEEFGCTLEQLFWRRTTRDEKCDGKVEVFHQEHPATPEQAFIGSGNPVFSQVLVSRMISFAEKSPAPVLGCLRGVDKKVRKTRKGTIEVPQRAVWVPWAEATGEDRDLWGRNAPLMVWEHPMNAVTQAGLGAAERRPDGQYVVFADVAMGDQNAQDGDWHAVQVLDHVTRMQVARYRSRIPLHDLPLALHLIGLYFNEAWLAPEVNGPGVAVTDVLRQELRYRRLYRRRQRGDSMVEGPQGALMGWLTTLSTKPMMEATFGQALKEDVHGCRDVATAREFTTYVQDLKNPAKHGAQKGSYDDLAMAFMGAHRVAAELRPKLPSGKASGLRRTVRDDVTGY